MGKRKKGDRFVFQWHITDKCSNRCRHCYINEFRNSDVSMETAYAILDDMRHCADSIRAMPCISITGGDPLMHPGIWDILRKAKDLDFQTTILGNPELMDEKTITRMIDHGVVRYQLSLDGMEKTHDWNRSLGSFERTTKAISLAAKLGLPIIAMSTVSIHNYLEMPDVMKHVYNSGGGVWSFTRHIPNHGHCGITPEEFENFLQVIVKEHAPFEGDKGRLLPKKEPLMSPIVSIPFDSNGIIAGGCGLASSTLVILPDNTVMACRRHRGSDLGKWKKQGDLINFFLFHPKMEYFRNIEIIQYCNSCEFLNQCRGCRAAAFANSGDNCGKDPQCFVASKREVFHVETLSTN
jgi:radical SAM protein with 4Fe4S-binding SPASM domain